MPQTLSSPTPVRDAVSQSDREMIRGLAREIAEIAALPVHGETADLWRALNDLKPRRPMVCIYQIPWHEMDVNGELAVQAESPMVRGLENQFRMKLYQWKHMRFDMLVDPWVNAGLVVHNTGYGFKAEEQLIAQDAGKRGIKAHHYHRQIKDEGDLEKLQTPEITFDREASDRNYERLQDLVGDILPVRQVGIQNHNFAPWDRLSEWWNPEQVLLDLALRPELAHAFMERFTSAYMTVLDRYEELNVLSELKGHTIAGQGGVALCSDLPGSDCDPGHIRLHNQWGGAMAQIFAAVSPAMHEEFALQYKARYLNRFGLSYYGCCEPLHTKVGISKKHIKNLRKISMSPWVDAGKGAEAIGGDLVFSFKPNPAFLATDGDWDRKSAVAEIEHVLEAAKDCAVEIILKDISTVRGEPRRLWEWTETMMEIAQEHGR